MQQNGLHLAVIMDGNGRWARQRGRPRTAGHVEGARAVREVVEAATAAPEIGVLTLYAFSSDNWERPRAEVRGLMRLLGQYLRSETERCVENGVRLEVIGRRDRLPPRLVARIRASERATGAACAASPGATPPRLHLRLAIDYSARDQLVRAAALAAARGADALDRGTFGRLLAEAAGEAGGPVPDVDLLVRTGGEQRLSDFLLWECAYAELLFTPVLWPDFGRAELEEALAAFRSRDRRFGRVLEEAS